MSAAQVSQFDKYIDDILKSVFKDQLLIKGLTHLLIVIYAAKLAPELPSQVLQVFQNQYFKLFVFSLIIWTAQFTPSTSLLIAVAFMISVNLANNKPYWEFMENIDSTGAPVAPSKDVAISVVSDAVDSQMTQPPVVTNISQQDNTIVVQPNIIDTPNGPAVVNPSVVVAPAIVESPNGEKVMVKPDITIVEPQQQNVVQATQAPIENVTPEPMPAKEESGCYPARQYDMTKVSGFESGMLAEI